MKTWSCSWPSVKKTPSDMCKSFTGSTSCLCIPPRRMWYTEWASSVSRTALDFAQQSSATPGNAGAQQCQQAHCSCGRGTSPALFLCPYILLCLRFASGCSSSCLWGLHNAAASPCSPSMGLHLQEILAAIARAQDYSRMIAKHREAFFKAVINSLEDVDAPFALKLVRPLADEGTFVNSALAP